MLSAIRARSDPVHAVRNKSRFHSCYSRGQPIILRLDEITEEDWNQHERAHPSDQGPHRWNDRLSRLVARAGNRSRGAEPAYRRHERRAGSRPDHLWSRHDRRRSRAAHNAPRAHLRLGRRGHPRAGQEGRRAPPAALRPHRPRRGPAHPIDGGLGRGLPLQQRPRAVGRRGGQCAHPQPDQASLPGPGRGHDHRLHHRPGGGHDARGRRDRAHPAGHRRQLARCPGGVGGVRRRRRHSVACALAQ